MEKYFEINEDNISVKCKLYYKDLNNINDIIISCHGFGGSKENNATKKLAQNIFDKYDDIAVLTFDWPCHGKDVRQKLNLMDCNNYLNKVIDYSYRRFSARDLYLNATSFGGYLTLKYILENENPFKKIVLRCPAVNMYEVLNNNILTEEDRHELSKGKSVLSGFERKIRITPEFLEDLKINDITKWNYEIFGNKILIAHGTNDTLVPINATRSFSEKNGIDFIDIDGADHMFTSPVKMHEFVLYATEFLLDESLNKNKNL